MRIFLLATLFLVACGNVPTSKPSPSESIHALDAVHNSRNSLDWTGHYSGTLVCDECPESRIELELSDDGRYHLRTGDAESGEQPLEISGHFQWTYDGNHIQLDANGDHAFFAVRENFLLRRHDDGTWPSGPEIIQMRLAKSR